MATPTQWGNEFLVNTITDGFQRGSAVTRLSTGGFVVAWKDDSGTLGDNNGGAVHAQIFKADGSKSGAEFLVNTATLGAQSDPSLTPLSDGRFVASWADEGSGNGDIRAQVFNPNGSKSGGEFIIGDVVQASQILPKLSTLADGRFVAAWAQDDGGSSPDARAQVFNPDGTRSGGELILDSNPFAVRTDPAITGLSDGRFVATWLHQDNPFAVDVRAQIFNANGSKSGLELVVAPANMLDHQTPLVTALAGGKFVVAWTDDDGLERHVDAQVFNADGSKAASGFLSKFLGNQDHPAIATLADGRFVVAVTDHTLFTNTIFGDVFNPDGTESGSAFDVNLYLAAGKRADPALSVLADGRFVATWTDRAPGDGSGSGIHAQIFDPRESAVHLTGGPLNDDFVGTKFNDDMKGGGGADHLDGGPGMDALIGGPGDDLYLVDSPDDSVIEDPGEGNDTIEAAVSYALPDNVENLKLLGGAGTISGTGNALDNLIVGNASPNVLDGADGNDTLNGGGGGDVLIGGPGDDLYVVDNVGDVVIEKPGEGNDTVEASVSYALPDNVENLKLLDGAGPISGTGNALDNLIVGNASPNVLDGAGGNDTLSGGGGGDVLIGGAGDDTAIFAHDFNDYTVMDFGARILVKGSEGTDTLTSIEHLKFADATITPVDDGDPLFDSLYYLSRNSDVFHAGTDARAHFDTFGWHEGRDPNPLFDVSGYLAVNPDVAGINPLEHYHQSGWKQGRDPSADFDTTLYLIHNPDVAAAGVDPLAHYLAFGASEGRQAWQAVGAITAGFDAQYYLLHNPDVAAAGVDARAHFDSFGWHEGRNPNGWFDSAGYLSHYADVAAAGVNPLEHYMQFGWKEGRDASAGFDTLGYLAANPDVAAAGVNPLEHFLDFGIYEGRQAVNDGLWH